jgi:riboflavin transporter FmnP
MNKNKESLFNKLTQYFLPIFTILGFLFTAIKKPEIGLGFNLVAQVFWLYASWKAWKQAGQIGLFITALILTCIVTYGLVNYWLIK